MSAWTKKQYDEMRRRFVYNWATVLLKFSLRCFVFACKIRAMRDNRKEKKAEWSNDKKRKMDIESMFYKNVLEIKEYNPVANDGLYNLQVISFAFDEDSTLSFMMNSFHTSSADLRHQFKEALQRALKMICSQEEIERRISWEER